MKTQVPVAPVHLGSLTAICEKFGRSRRTVRDWLTQGAPIAFDGVRYCAEYNQLMNWWIECCQHRTADKDKARPAELES